MSRGLKWLLGLNLAALAVLAFVYPELMISPGPVKPAHAALQKDCFACHAPLTGAASERCTTCHLPRDIGRVTTTGLPLEKRTPFHQGLIKQDCMACHREHTDRLGANAQAPVRFDHSLLQPAEVARCDSCHARPKTELHRLTQSAPCTQCHTTQAWTPATFNHDQYFRLDGDHRATCATCHPRNDTTRYTCYGCHEHTPTRIRAEHVEEGITDFLNCVDCHGPRAKKRIGDGEDD